MAYLACMHIIQSEKKLINDHGAVLLLKTLSLFDPCLDFATLVEGHD